MKKMIISLVAMSGLAVWATFAHAEPDACQGPMQGQAREPMEDMMFKKMDTNADGAVSKSEFNAFNAKRFKELDADKNGKVTLAEMGDLRKKAMVSRGMEHLDKRFAAADANQDGGLDREEAQAMPYVTMYFDEVDTNKDGKVTREEYLAAMPLLHRVKKEKAESF